MFAFWATLIVAADQATKLWAMNRFAPGGAELDVAFGLSFTYVRNDGAAFGLFQALSLPIGPVTVDGTLLLGLVSAAVATALVLYLSRSRSTMTPLTVGALTLILGGAVGNMIDRFWRGYVVDFIHFQRGDFNFAVFNVADMAVVIGAGLLILAAFTADDEEHDAPAEARTEQRRGVPDDAGRFEAPRVEDAESSVAGRFERRPRHERDERAWSDPEIGPLESTRRG